MIQTHRFDQDDKVELVYIQDSSCNKKKKWVLIRPMAGPASSSATIYAVKEELCYSSQMDRLFSSVIMDFWMHGEISSLLITNKDSGRNHK